ncbi:MAG: VCBS repeat-containing protein [Elusimicrobiota bacterium]|nr:VCBS repeat-containing protein [Elusimicrobiota bacterium]
MKRSFFVLLLALQTGMLTPLRGQAPGRPVGWRVPQCELRGGSFYPYPSPEKISGPFELVTKWSVPADLALTGDVNGDGKIELVAQAGNKISVYSGRGILLSSASVAGELRIGALQDINGDKIDDILLAGRVKNKLVVLFLKGSGAVIKRFVINPHEISVLSEQMENAFGAAIHGVTDMDGDGKREVILSLGAGYKRLPRGVLSLDSATGAQKWYYPAGPAITQVLVHDINRDGQPDVLAAGYSIDNGNVAPDTRNDSTSYLYSFREAGRANWIRELGGYFTGARIAVQDIDRDSTEEIVVSAYRAWQHIQDADSGFLATINGLTGEFENKVPSDMSLEDKGLVISNAAGSGRSEIVIGGREGLIRKYDPALKLLGTYASTGPVSVLAGNDFIRTGRPDYFAVTDNNNLLVLDNDLKLVSGFEYPSGGREVTLLVSDLLPGGSNELVLVSDKAYVLTAATKPEDQFDVAYKILKDLPTGQIQDLKRLGASAAKLTIKNKTGREAHLRVRHVLQNSGKEQFVDGIDVPADSQKEVELFPDIQPEISSAAEPSAAYSITVERVMPDGSYQTISSREPRIRIHPKSRFFPVLKDAAGKEINLLASLVNWVDPQSAEVAIVVDSASQTGKLAEPTINIVGDQSPGAFRGTKDNRTLEEKTRDSLEQVELAYNTLEKIYPGTYKSTPLVLRYKAGVSQNVLSPGETTQKSGNCIDNAVLFASILERMEFRPLVMLILDEGEGHAIVGWMLEHTPESGPTAYGYRFLDTNKFSPKIGFKEVLNAGQALVDLPRMKTILASGIPFKDGVFSSVDGRIVILDVTAIRDQIAD